ncbi:hypothetical protein CDAR_187631, partial [Caerostris darwini]
INSSSIDGLSLKEAKKLIDNTKEKLHLVVRRDSHKNSENHDQWAYRVASDSNLVQNKGQ